jgi:hypothetical protein
MFDLSLLAFILQLAASIIRLLMCIACFVFVHGLDKQRQHLGELGVQFQQLELPRSVKRSLVLLLWPGV